MTSSTCRIVVERREHHRIEREVVLLGEVAAEGPEQHVRPEDEQVRDGGT